MAVAGLRGTGDWAPDQRPKNFREMILWRNPNGTAPLTALMSKMKSESLDDPEFNWWEEELNAFRFQGSAAFTSAVTTLTFVASPSTGGAFGAVSGDAQNLVPGDLLMVESAITSSYANEIVMVSSVTNATTLVVKRGQSGTTQAAIVDGAYLTKIGNVYEEGSGSPNATTRNPDKLYNYAQIFKTAYRITETAKNTKTRTGDPLKNDKKRKMFDHSTSLEMAFLFGKRFETPGPNGKPMRTTGGLLSMLSTYAPQQITAFTTTPTEETFLNATYRMFDYDTEAGNERIAFCGNGFINSLNKLAKSSPSTRINFDGFVEVYKMKLQRWILPQGEIYLRTHPLFNLHGRFQNDAFMFDPTVIKYRHMRDTKMQDNIQLPDADEQKGQWLTEAGLELQHAKTCAWVSNFIV
jgi:hypothetical protein